MRKQMSYYESQQSSESSDSNFQLERMRKSKCSRNINFEKNYPKNILISILACLDLKGWEQVYQEQGISEKQIQKRNSASLLDIHKILTHPLMKLFNKEQFQLLASNILLQNSKISKKAFHLEILRDIFSFEADVPFPEFKSEMKKRAKINCSKNASNIQIFQSQSSTIYLLTLFCKVIENYPNIGEDLLENRQSTEEQINRFENFQGVQKNLTKSNRQLLKPLIHLLCSKLSRQNWTKEKRENVYDCMREMIIQTEHKMVQKLNLKQGVPYLRLFCPEVVSKCFEFIESEQKLTFSLVEKWVKAFEKQSLLKIAKNFCFVTEPIEDLYNKQQVQIQQRKGSKSVNFTKGFSPIVLTLRN